MDRLHPDLSTMPMEKLLDSIDDALGSVIESGFCHEALAEIRRRASAQTDALEAFTPLGRLVATTRDSAPPESVIISVDLEKPDGTSGQIAQVEIVSGSLAEGYPTPIHTFAWNGCDEDIAARVDCDPLGECMAEIGWEHGNRNVEAHHLPPDPRALASMAERAARPASAEQSRACDGPRHTHLRNARMRTSSAPDVRARECEPIDHGKGRSK